PTRALCPTLFSAFFGAFPTVRRSRTPIGLTDRRSSLVSEGRHAPPLPAEVNSAGPLPTRALCPTLFSAFFGAFPPVRRSRTPIGLTDRRSSLVSEGRHAPPLPAEVNSAGPLPTRALCPTLFSAFLGAFLTVCRSSGRA